MQEITLLTYLSVLMIAFAGGVVQTATGFGAGIVMMMVTPFFFGVTSAAAINTSVIVVLTVALVRKYFKRIDLKLTLPLVVPYLLTSIVCIKFTPYIDTKKLGIAFGCFLVALSLFFLLLSSRIKLPTALPMVILYGLLSGVFSGLFGVGGPLIAIFLLNTTPDKDGYLANTQFIFLVTGLINTLTRCLTGIYTLSLVPFSVAGLVGILFGKRVGLVVSGKIRPDRLKLIVYIFVGISGLLTIRKYLML